MLGKPGLPHPRAMPCGAPAAISVRRWRTRAVGLGSYWGCVGVATAVANRGDDGRRPENYVRRDSSFAIEEDGCGLSWDPKRAGERVPLVSGNGKCESGRANCLGGIVGDDDDSRDLRSALGA